MCISGPNHSDLEIAQRQRLQPELSSHCHSVNSGKKTAHKLMCNPQVTGQVSLEHPAGQTGVYRAVSQGFLVGCFRTNDSKGHVCRDTGWVSKKNRPSSRFLEKLHPFGFRIHQSCAMLIWLQGCSIGSENPQTHCNCKATIRNS